MQLVSAHGGRRLALSPLAVLVLCAALGATGADVTGDAPALTTTPAVTLEIGPVSGLTTAWHTAPDALTVPAGLAATFRVDADDAATIAWSGAVEAQRADGVSLAERTFADVGPAEVSVEVDGIAARIAVEVVEAEAALAVTALRPLAGGVGLIDEEGNIAPAAAFAERSIAELFELDETHFLTSIDRDVTFEADASDTPLAGLLEWRVDGEPVALGATLTHAFDEIGEHEVAVGPPMAESTVTVETYSVSIVSSSRAVRDGDAMTFVAVTDPPGLESAVTWLASTAQGTATPPVGFGPAFTVVFTDTEGADGRDVTVSADDASADFGDAPTQIYENVQQEEDTKLPIEPQKPTEFPLQTFCPQVATSCPQNFTTCPESVTHCPEQTTVCPEEQTMCPIVTTVCPTTFFPVTLCSSQPTVCPTTPTWCPFIPTICIVPCILEENLNDGDSSSGQ